MHACRHRRGGAWRWRSLLAAVAVLMPAVATAQASPAGRWITEYYRTAMSHGGSGEAELARARLTLTLQGDSVSGSWQDLMEDGEPEPAPRALRGVISRGVVTLTADPVTAILRQHMGPDQRITLISSYEFTVRGDSLVGTQQSRSADGKITNNPRPFTALREKP